MDQFPSKAFSCSLRSNGWDGLQNFQHPGFSMNRNLLAVYPNFETQMLNGAVLSEPESELTCNNGSGSRKRSRENNNQMLDTFKSHQERKIGVNVSNRVQDASRTATTSGTCQQSDHYLYDNDVELEAFIRLQNQNLCTAIEEAWKRHYRWIMWMIEQQTQKRLEEKETELTKISRANAELEERIMQMNAERQVWFNNAKNNEAIVSSLRMRLEEVLLFHNSNEGYGETEAESKTEEKQGKSCRGCGGGGDVCVIILPCRHLCICKDCEFRIGRCPVCSTLKSATLQVFMP